MNALAKAEARPNFTYTLLDVDKIRRSPLNHRTRFPGLEELGEDIKANGLKVPIKARPVANDKKVTHELVYGERRWRAAQLAGVTQLPALVQNLSDVEVIKEQLVENCSRVDVHPLEEADGYRMLMDKHGYDVEQLATETGKSTSAIYARLKLNDLKGKAARDAFLEEKINASIALLIARVPDAKLQDRATKEILEGKAEDQLVHGEWIKVTRPLSYREAQLHLQANYMLLLAKAPFPIDDANLVKAAGSCVGCLFRTGNQRELFDDVKSADVCTNPPCFSKKKETHAANELAKWKKEGKDTLPQKEISKAFEKSHNSYAEQPGAYHLKWGADFAKAEEKPPYHIDPKQRTWAELFGGDDKVPVVLAKTPDGEMHRLIDVKHARETLAKAGMLKAPRKSSSSSGKSKGPSPKDLIQARARKKIVGALVDKLVAKAEADDIAFWRWFAKERLWNSNSDADQILGDVRGKWHAPDAEKLIKVMGKAEVRRLALEASVCHALSMDRRETIDDDTKETCASFKVDWEELASDAKVEITKELAEAAAKPKKPAKPAKKDKKS